MVNTRRSLDTALAMTPSKMAFIQGDSTVNSQSVVPAKERPEEQTAEVRDPQIAHPSLDIEHPATEPAQREKLSGRTPKRQGKGQDSQDFDDAMLGMANLLVPLTTRLQPRTAAVLKRAGLEQKLRGKKPSTVQEIVEIAIQQWLREASYLS